MTTFMSNDFKSLEPWKDSMTSIRLLRPLYTIIVSILLLNMLIALLITSYLCRHLKSSFQSRNIWYRQWAAMLVEIERGVLTESERKNPHWFPRWFNYTLTESDRNEWQSFMENHPSMFASADATQEVIANNLDT
jgi:hypothetical protein